MTEQAVQLAEKPHVVISTPGRLADHIESGTNFSLSKIQMLVWIVFFYSLIFCLVLNCNPIFNFLDTRRGRSIVRRQFWRPIADNI